MAVQQNKKSPSKRGMHRSHNAVAAPGTAIEPTTGRQRQRFHWLVAQLSKAAIAVGLPTRSAETRRRASPATRRADSGRSRGRRTTGRGAVP